MARRPLLLVAPDLADEDDELGLGVGLVSRSGTLTYQIGYELASVGVGNSTIVGIGGDPVVGTTPTEVAGLVAARLA